MRKKTLILVLIIFVSLIFEKLDGEQDIVKEFVKVLNIEVPVRVFFKGKPVDNLEKKDFILYEGKKRQKINGFYIVKKKIKTQKVGLESERKESLKSRYFILVFHITDYNRELKRGLNYVLNNILTEKDKVLVFINYKTIFFNSLSDKGKAHSIIENFLKEQSSIARIRLYKYIQKVEKMYRLRFDLIRIDKTLRFFQKYLLLWKEYKKKYLILDLDTYYNFARFLEKINLEKWVINFYQVEMFPQFKSLANMQLDDLISKLQSTGTAEDINNARMLYRYLRKIKREFRAADDFPSDEIGKIFLKANTTFHSIFFRTYREMVSDTPIELERISTDIENSLREITMKTGGELIVSNKINTALNKIEEKEDILYMLNYSPEDPGEKGKIKVKVKNKDYKIYYDDNFRADYLREYLEKKKIKHSFIKIKKLEFKEKTLTMVISDFFMKKKAGTFRGKMSINIKIKTMGGETLLEKEKKIKASEDTVSISLLLNWLKQGEYNIVVNVKDQLTEKAAIDFLKAEVN